MTLLTSTFITSVVAVATWMTPMPSHAEGWLVLYGPERLARANAEYRGYSLDNYACGLAVMSPADLGKIVWLRTGDSWFGPCLAVDTSARKDFYANVFVRHEIAEVDERAAEALGFECGAWGEAYVGLCPPDDGSPQRYTPELIVDRWTPEASYLRAYWPFPLQQRPVYCHNAGPFAGMRLPR